MTRHFLWFLAVSFRNRMRLQARRLRSPRYAIAALVGLLYFAFLFGAFEPPPVDGEAPIGEVHIAAARRLGPLLVGLLAAWWWLRGGHRHGLVLSPAETHLLVPAPLTRPELVRFRVLQAQLPILLSATLATLLTRYSGLPWPLRFLSLWVLLATLHQHQIAASLVHAAAEEQGRRGLRRVWLPLLLFSAAAGGVAWSVWGAVQDIRLAGLRSIGPRIIALTEEPVYSTALFPFRMVLRPVTAADPQAWLPAFGVALLVLAAHYVWLQRTDAAFEEGAAAAGAERDARAAALQAGGFARVAFSEAKGRLGRPILPLHPTGWPAWALFWKNVLHVQRLLRPGMLVLLAALVLLVGAPSILMADSPLLAVRNAGFGLAILAALAAVGGPFAFRNDLRLDLGHLEALRVMPLAGRDVVTAEVAAPFLPIGLLLLIAGGAGAVLLTVAGTIAPGMAAAAVAAGAVVLLPLAALNVGVQNLLALLYPGWIRIGHDTGGMESFGQNILTMVGSLIIMVLALLPPLLVAGLVAGLLLLVSTVAAAVAGTLVLGAALLLEAWLLILWLGRLYDRTDPVAVGTAGN